MNNNIKDKILTDKQDVSKNHQAFAMELSRLKAAKKICTETKNCSEYETLGGDARYMQIETMVQVPRKTDEIMRDSQKDTNPNSVEKNSSTDVSTPNVTRGADHSGGKKKKNYNNIISNSQALNEEISTIKYLIEYMNNNKKQNL